MNEKVKAVIELQETGLNRNEIAQRLSYQRVDSLNRFMRNNGYIFKGGKFIIESKGSLNKEHTKSDIKQNSQNRKVEIKVSYNNDNCSFSVLDGKITEDIVKEYERLKYLYSGRKLYMLSLIILKDNLDLSINKEYETSKLVTNVRSFFETAFKNDFEKLREFLDIEDIPYNYELFSSYNSIRTFTKTDDRFCMYLENLSMNDLEQLRNKLSLINPFTENFRRALQKNRNE